MREEIRKKQGILLALINYYQDQVHLSSDTGGHDHHINFSMDSSHGIPWIPEYGERFNPIISTMYIESL